MKPIVDPKGQWAHPGKVTTIPGNNITMKGVNYPVLGISNTGDKKLMLPGQNYKFKGKYVTEYPWLKKYQAGGEVNPSQQVYDKQKELLTGLGLPMPSAADSAALYKNTLALDKFYTNPSRGYQVMGNETPYYSLNLNESLESNKFLYDRYKENASGTIANAKATLKSDKNFYLSPDRLSSSTFSRETYDNAIAANKKFSDYQHQVQDNITGAINPSAPVNYQDFRITPSSRVTYKSETDPGHITVLSYYDPMDVKPWSMRTEKEKEYHRNRMKMLANSMTGSSTPSTALITPLKPKTFGEVTRLPEKGIDINKTTAVPNLKKPINNKVVGIMPSFMIPSTGSAVKGDMDLYEWDYELKKYVQTNIVSADEGRYVYKAIYKSSLDSLNSELNNSNFGNKKRNPFVKTYQSGGQLPPLYVPSTEDPRYKAYSDSLSLYNGSKAAYTKDNFNDLKERQDRWFELMMSPNLTAEDRKKLRMPDISDYATYEESIKGLPETATSYLVSGRVPYAKPAADIIDKNRLLLTKNRAKYIDSNDPYNANFTDYNASDAKKYGYQSNNIEYALRNSDNPIKPHYINYYGEGAFNLLYKKPVQPVKVANSLTLDPFYVYPEASTKLPETPIKTIKPTTNKTVSPKLRGPIDNKVVGIMPSFMIPSTGSSVEGDRDLYEWDYELKKYVQTRIVSPDEGRNVYDAIYKSSLDSLNSELNNSKYGNKKRNPFVK